MKGRNFFLLVLFLLVLWGLSSCGTVQIVSEKTPAAEPPRQAKAPPEKIPPEKTAPKAPAPPEAPAEKGFLQKMLQKVAPTDTFSRTYPVEFASFHPQANSALQNSARTRKGNSFRISRLGSNEVVLKGIYLREGTRETYSLTLVARPAGAKKSELEIKAVLTPEGTSGGDPEAAAKEVFLIIDKFIGNHTP
jgi:hypothetical protein